VAGLALAFSLAVFINFTLLLIWLKKRLVYLDLKEIFVSFAKIFFVSLASMGAAYLTLHYVGNSVNMRTFWGVFIQAAAGSLSAVLFYFAFSFALNLDEVKIFKKYLFKFFKKSSIQHN